MFTPSGVTSLTTSPTACDMSRIFEMSSRRSVKFTLPSNAPIGGIRMSLTSDETIFPNAPPMITPTAMSITLPFMANSLNSLKNPILFVF